MSGYSIDNGNAEHCRRVLKLHTDDYNREMIRIRAQREQTAVRSERDVEAKHAFDLAVDVADEIKNRQGESARRQQELRDALNSEQERWASSRPAVKAAARRRCLSGVPTFSSAKSSRASRDVPPGWAGPPPPSVVVKRAMVGRGEFEMGNGEDPATGAVPLRQNPTHEERRRRKLEYKMLLDEQSATVPLALTDTLPNAVLDVDPLGKQEVPSSRPASRCGSPLPYQNAFKPRGRRSQSARGTPEPTSLNYTYHQWEVAEASRIKHLQRWMAAHARAHAPTHVADFSC